MFNLFKYHKFFLGLSGVVLLISVVSLAMFGLRLGIDFTGGTLTELSFPKTPDVEWVNQAAQKSEIGTVISQTTNDNGLLVKTGVISKDQHDKFLSALGEVAGEYTQVKYESIGPVIGKELRTDAFWQLLLVSAGIIFYIAYAFRKVQRPITSWRFGVAAVLALVHDLLVVLGVFALLGHFRGVEIDSMFVTAMLTVLGFSVHDTIVVFDRIRENLRVYAGQSLEYVVNQSVTQTVVRSLNTSFTVLFVLLALLLFGGQSIYYFVLALFVGIVTGTYSSIFIASPILVLWQNWDKKKKGK